MPARIGEYSVVCEMPVDTLLLNASPPGLGSYYSAAPVTYFRSRPSPLSNGISMGFGKRGGVALPQAKLPLRSCIKPTVITSGSSTGWRTTPTPPEPVGNKSDKLGHCMNSTNGKDSSNLDDPHENTQRTGLLISKRKQKKTVSFADAKGLSLYSVKIMDEPSNEPPNLRIHTLEDIVQGEEAKPTFPFTYVPDFDQPASNYLEFRDRLERDCVCLENVMINDNILTVGTVKVKNIAYNKCVRVRVSFDEWKTHEDIDASYVLPSRDGRQSHNSHDKYDTFSFEIDVPPNLAGRSFEFCISYTSNNKTFWDNNRGCNYKIVSEQEKELTQNKNRNCFQNLSGQNSWGQFSYWQVVEDERPYW